MIALNEIRYQVLIICTLLSCTLRENIACTGNETFPVLNTYVLLNVTYVYYECVFVWLSIDWENYCWLLSSGSQDKKVFLGICVFKHSECLYAHTVNVEYYLGAEDFVLNCVTERLMIFDVNWCLGYFTEYIVS